MLIISSQMIENERNDVYVKDQQLSELTQLHLTDSRYIHTI